MKKSLLTAFLMLSTIGTFAQNPTHDLSKDKILYTVGYAHLDTEWNWDYPTTINHYIKSIMLENFHLFEKYPEYVFNFTGSRRYEMMKEYYPELYPKVKAYIKAGRWRVSGSSVDEGEVNISSSESMIRQVLYGNQFFKKEFGVQSYDYMLPDCFGFLANAPSIWNHCGLLGFSTQKLSWNSAVGIPFNVGVWNGPDGKGIIAALNATDYTGRVTNRLDLDERWNARLDDNFKKYGFSFDYRYYGVGDEGGAPRERDVKNAIGSMNNPDSKFKVVLSSSDQLFKDITPEIRKKLPVYSGDLLLIEHSAGSMTSQSYMKRMNRKNEILAESAEKLACIADWKNRIPYPTDKLNNAWNLLLGSQFHDILPGTSIPKAYEYAWNDEFIAANGFANVLNSSMSAVSMELNTQVQGRSLVVFNPVATLREDLVTAEMQFDSLPKSLQVFDWRGRPLPTQIIKQEGNKLTFIFPARVHSLGMSVFDVREVPQPIEIKTSLAVTEKSIENIYYRVIFDTNGDMKSIYDKKLARELLSKPAGLEFLSESPSNYPAWNMDWKDRKLPIIGTMDEDAQLKIVENGPVRVCMEVVRKGRNSVIRQRISLAAGDAGKRVEVSNILDWQSTGVSLKATFPLTASNPQATYNLGVGAIQRTNNDSLKFEVPSKQWFDLTDRSASFGVTILEDCKYGSDKPDDQTLRLTLMYTPATRNGYRYQNTQDWGVHEFRYGIYSHNSLWKYSQAPWQGEFFNKPMLAQETTKHVGGKREIALFQCSASQVNVMAFKKMEGSDLYIVRVQEMFGVDLRDVRLQLPDAYAYAYEVDGQEQPIGPKVILDREITFDLGHYGIKSFAFLLEKDQPNAITQNQLELPFDQDAMSFDTNRDDCNFNNRNSLPAELIPAEIVSEGIRYQMGSTTDGSNNVVACNGQKINIKGNHNKLYLLASATNDLTAEFRLDGKPQSLKIQRGSGFIGQFYNRIFAQDNVTVTRIQKPYYKDANIAWFASHGHYAYPSRNDAYQYTYLYAYELEIPQGAEILELPVNSNVKVFAITLANDKTASSKLVQSLTDDFSQVSDPKLRIQ